MSLGKVYFLATSCVCVCVLTIAHESSLDLSALLVHQLSALVSSQVRPAQLGGIDDELLGIWAQLKRPLLGILG